MQNLRGYIIRVAYLSQKVVEARFFHLYLFGLNKAFPLSNTYIKFLLL